LLEHGKCEYDSGRTRMIRKDRKNKYQTGFVGRLEEPKRNPRSGIRWLSNVLSLSSGAGRSGRPDVDHGLSASTLTCDADGACVVPETRLAGIHGPVDVIEDFNVWVEHVRRVF
jgi:hypothetical protein